MKLSTRLKNINFFLAQEKEIILFGKKKYSINLSGRGLSKEFYEDFFMSPRLGEKFDGVYRKTGAETFTTTYSCEKAGTTIFYDIYSFFHSYINGELYGDEGQICGFVFSGSIYAFYYTDIVSVLENIVYGLSEDSYNTLHKIFYNRDIEMFLGETYAKKQKRIMVHIKKKIRYLKRGNVMKISSKGFRNYLIHPTHQRTDMTMFPRSFSTHKYINSFEKTIKIRTGLFQPIKGLSKFKTHFSTIGTGYSGIFGINHKSYLFSDENLNYSTGFDVSNPKIAKIKAFCEGMERFNSGYFSSEILLEDVFMDSDKILSEKILGYPLSDELLGERHKFGVTYEIIAKDDDSISRSPEASRIPHELLYYPSIPGEKRFYYASSNGIGAGRTYEEALMGGIFELSERDSLMLTWLLKLSPNSIDIQSLPNNLIERVHDIEKIGRGKIYIFDISYDKGFPHILVIQRKENDGHYGVGASAGFILEDVVGKALSEASVSSIYWNEETEKTYSFCDVKKVQDHKIFYDQGANCEKYLGYLFQRNTEIQFGQLNNFFNKHLHIGLILKDLMNTVGGRFYVSNLTTEYSRGLGIYVVRVLSESLIPIWFGIEGKIPYSKDRLRSLRFDKWKGVKYNLDIPDFLHFFD